MRIIVEMRKGERNGLSGIEGQVSGSEGGGATPKSPKVEFLGEREMELKSIYDVYRREVWKVGRRKVNVYFAGGEWDDCLNNLARMHYVEVVSRSEAIFLSNGVGVWFLKGQERFPKVTGFISGRLLDKELEKLIEAIERRLEERGGAK